jgi:hypothetical protein
MSAREKIVHFLYCVGLLTLLFIAYAGGVRYPLPFIQNFLGVQRPAIKAPGTPGGVSITDATVLAEILDGVIPASGEPPSNLYELCRAHGGGAYGVTECERLKK